MSKSLIISGIAGNSIVSPYMAIRIVEPRIASVIQAHLEIFCFNADEEPVVFLSSSGFTTIKSLTRYWTSIENM